ncbi:MAG: DUF2183 domain-containing protein [Pirellulaceae bacterium]|nr:DUF2183 domain-containing protein [Pirellulaceae bacterium]
MVAQPGPLTNLRATDTVVLYPTFGHPVDGGRAWRVMVRGAVYEPGEVKLRQKLMIRMLQRVMQVPRHALETEIFLNRIQDFTWITERGRRLAVRVGTKVYRLQRATRRNGHFAGVVRIREAELESLREAGHCQDDWLRYQVVTLDGDQRELTGRARLLPHGGLSVISDIDDTVRHSQVGCRRSLLANTFLREFSTVSGIVDLYRTWEAQGAVFHYVSSSPWQLYRPLIELWQQEGIPDGTFHLRLFRLRDHMLRRLLLLRSGKGAVIRSLLDHLPNRRFVLVGDSGEHDPEIYGAMARKYRDLVEAIFIRQIPSKPLDAARCRRAFKNLPESSWRLFDEPEELRDALPRMELVGGSR